MTYKDEIPKLHGEGKTYRQIKEILGCSLGTISYHMGAGQKLKASDRRKKNRSKVLRYIRNYKQEKGCADCGENYPYWVLDFDHISEKEFNIGGWKQVTSNIEKIKIEMAKCEIVCANCHRDRTHSRMLSLGEYPEIEEFYDK